MFYNVLEFPELNPNRISLLQDILQDYSPDIFMVCELQSQEGADVILNVGLNSNGNSNYSAAPYFENQSGGGDLQQALFYRNDMFVLENTEIINTPVRDINKYTLLLNTESQDTNPIRIYAYVTHLKSSQGSANQQLRLSMVEAFVNDTEQLEDDAFVLFAGDFNIYTSTEPAYLEILDQTNSLAMADPIDTPGSWNNNEDFRAVHTQSTRTSSSGFGGGAGGGLDDRFDFIMVSQNMMTNPNLQYKTDSYKAYGNNGNCYNNNINDINCGGVYNQIIRDALYNMSDHLPVVMELETDQEIVILDIPQQQLAQPFSLKRTLVSDVLTVYSPQGDTQDDSFVVFNTLGQEILNFKTKANTTIIDVSLLAKGVYYLTNTSSNKTLKFLKTF
ncbi:endonuclease/exonuclease/phosphatase family protein [Flavobacteriaceae bacterium]|nr:endonuclease/exonuclease/phosphatase family protein [Flavobacteriaceae bacterium]MDC1200104.1 endonuclease/exonuclease/phosphatase family protein [bacterium]